jgi:hypothetical protein
VREGRSLQLQAWATYLPHDYKDREFILNGIEFGFEIVYTQLVKGYTRLRNHSSVYDNAIRHKVEQSILTEIEHGRYIIANVMPNIISPLGAIIKSNGDVRIIHDCSRPAGRSVNDYAPVESVRYQSIEDAKEFITWGCYLAKIDLASAYRSVKLHPSNYCVTGLAWQFEGDNCETVLMDTTLCFGARRSPYIFNTLTQAVVYIMKRRGYDCIAYIDDFLICHKTYEGFLDSFNTLLGLLRELGFSISYPKLVLPTQTLVFLGITIDTATMTLSLPNDKLTDLRQLVNESLSTKTLKKRDLQVLVGKLAFATRVYRGGLCFLRRVIDVINRLKKPWSRFHMNGSLRADLLWWQQILAEVVRTVPIIDDKNALSVVIEDAIYGWRASMTNRALYLPAQSTSTPTYNEAQAVVRTACQWAHIWTNKRVYVHCNSVGAVTIINKGSCKNAIVMRYLRELWRLSVVYNFTLTARLYHHTGSSLANHEPIYARRSQPRLLPPAAAGSGISAVYEDDISSTPTALPTVLSTSKLQGTSSGVGDHSTIYRLPLLDTVATDHSLSPVCNSHAACSAWSGHRHNIGTPSSLRTAGGHERGHLTPTPDEAHDSLAIKAHFAPAEFSDARRPPVLGSCPPHVLLPPSSQQCAGYDQHGTGSTCLAQGRRESRPQAGGTHDPFQQDGAEHSGTSTDCYPSPPGSPPVPSGGTARRPGAGTRRARHSTFLPLAQWQGLLPQALHGTPTPTDGDAGRAPQRVWVPQFSSGRRHSRLPQRRALGVDSAPRQLEIRGVHALPVYASGCSRCHAHHGLQHVTISLPSLSHSTCMGSLGDSNCRSEDSSHVHKTVCLCV